MSVILWLTLWTVPMEEVVRAFNWVIEKGWVSTLHCVPPLHLFNYALGVLLGYLRVVRTSD